MGSEGESKACSKGEGKACSKGEGKAVRVRAKQ
jgi:hypothetical protein